MSYPIFSHKFMYEIHIICDEGQLILWDEGVVWRKYNTRPSSVRTAAEKVTCTFRDTVTVGECWDEIT